MGGDCSQKAHALEGTPLLSGAKQTFGSLQTITLAQELSAPLRLFQV
jgi:hypothetical protein